MKTVKLEDHHPEYILNVLETRWRKLDEERKALPLQSGYEYRDKLSEQQRIEVIQERLKDAE